MGNINSKSHDIEIDQYEITSNQYEYHTFIQYYREFNKWVSIIPMQSFGYAVGYYDTREEAVIKIKIKNKLKLIFGEAENRPFIIKPQKTTRLI
jgi:hypothetical protein